MNQLLTNSSEAPLPREIGKLLRDKTPSRS